MNSGEREALHASYRASFPAKLAALRGALGDPAASPSAQELAHRLHGSAGTYGFPEVGQAAALLERRLAEHAPEAEVQAAFDALAALLDAPA